VRASIERRLRKQLRRLRPAGPELVAILNRHERSGVSLESALQRVILDPAAGWYLRGFAARILALADPRVIRSLLDLFFVQTDKIELWETALTIEHFGDRAAVRPLAEALYDSNPHRCHAAARALGWIPKAGVRAAKALIRALSDKTQPQPVREEAAESLAYLGYAGAIPELISVLSEPDVRLRFWAVFALGGIGQRQTYAPRGSADPRVVEALERMLSDQEVTPGNWWSVGREALAMLGHFDPKYRAELDSETERVLGEPNSSPEDLRWAAGYSPRSS
jgi:HEAT repeat protein